MEVSKTMSKQSKIILIATLVLFTIFWRVSPHLANFAPAASLALLSGVVFRSRLALIPVAVAMGVSDLIIGGYSGMEFTWLAFAGIVFLGVALSKLKNKWLIPIGALSSSILFFVVSNFGVWVASGMYAHTFAGLMQCYVMGLPFLRATMLSDLFFVTLFTSIWVLAPTIVKNLKHQPARSLGVQYD
jgi:hypothetical protein